MMANKNKNISSDLHKHVSDEEDTQVPDYAAGLDDDEDEEEESTQSSDGGRCALFVLFIMAGTLATLSFGIYSIIV